MLQRVIHTLYDTKKVLGLAEESKTPADVNTMITTRIAEDVHVAIRISDHALIS
jgi:hypothetical protein